MALHASHACLATNGSAPIPRHTTNSIVPPFKFKFARQKRVFVEGSFTLTLAYSTKTMALVDADVDAMEDSGGRAKKGKNFCEAKEKQLCFSLFHIFQDLIFYKHFMDAMEISDV